MYCADIKASDDAADGLIPIAIDASNLKDCAEDIAGGLISDIDAGVSMNFTDKQISDDAADELITTPIYSTDNDDTNALDDAIDRLMMLMCLSLLQ